MEPISISLGDIDNTSSARPTCEDEGARLSLHGLTLRDLIHLCVDIGPNSSHIPVLFALLFVSLGFMGPLYFGGPIYPLISLFLFPFLALIGPFLWAFPLFFSLFFGLGLKWVSPSLRPIIGPAYGREDPSPNLSTV